MKTESSKRLSLLWKGVATGVGGMLLLLALMTGILHYGMDECPFCGLSMNRNGSPTTQSEDLGTE